MQAHSRAVNCLSFDLQDSGRLISTSYDGTVRCFDLRAQAVTLVLGDVDNGDFYTTYHGQIDAHSFLVTMGGNSGRVGLVDTRESNAKFAKTLAVFNKSAVKTVDVHPLRRDLFLCPSNKAECAIFDLRAAKERNNQSGVLKPVLELQGHSRSISSAFFSPETGKSVCTVAYDNKVTKDWDSVYKESKTATFYFTCSCACTSLGRNLLPESFLTRASATTTRRADG